MYDTPYPLAIINSEGIILWSNRNDKKYKLCLQINKSLNSIIPNFHSIFKYNSYVFTNIQNENYKISFNQWDDKTILLFENYISLKIDDDASLNVTENELLTILLDSRYEGVVFVDLEGNMRYVNDIFRKYSRIPIDKLINHNIDDYTIDPYLKDILKTQENQPLEYTYNGQKSYIVSRRPVYYNDNLVGAFGRYISIDSDDIKNDFDDNYYNILSNLNFKDIIENLSQTIMELNSYKDEFYLNNRSNLGINKIIGNSNKIRLLKKQILTICNSPSPVLITGETGTGKELVAQSLHFHGNRSSHPFVTVNCAAIPENLLESELFGYVEGAFTGAKKGGKMGKFELANKGVLFLDEIGDMPMPMQVKLLRVLQQKEVERLGDEKVIPIDVRIIAATNKDLLSLIDEGLFREDLYYRINVLNIDVPPLRDRKEDIPEIINYKIDEFNKTLGRSILDVTPEAISLLVNYNWPGNIRELSNVIESSMNYCSENLIDTSSLPNSLHSNLQNKNDINHKLGNENKKKSLTNDGDLQDTLDDMEKIQLIKALKQNNGNRAKTSTLLNISKSTLYRLMKKHDLLNQNF